MSEDEGMEATAADADAEEPRDGEATADGTDGTPAEADGEEQPTGDGAETADEAEAGADGAADAEQAADDAAAQAAGTVTPDDGDEGPTGRNLVGRVSEHDEELGREVEALLGKALTLQETVDELERERDELAAELESAEAENEELESKLRRKQADFQNYKKRAKKRQDQIRDRATEDLVERLVDVRDNLKRGLDADHEDVESLESGIEMTLKEFDRVLAEENVEEIDPGVGGEVDPQRHEVMMRVESDQPEGTVAEVYKPGYEMAGKVIQAAQVTVSEGPADGTEGEPATADGEADGGGDDGEAVALGDGSDDGGDDGTETADDQA